MLPISGPGDVPPAPQEAARFDYVGFLHRAPYAIDAWELGFVTGRREDCTLRQTDYRTVSVPTLMLDNDFRRADRERMLNRVREVRPRIAVLADVTSVTETEQSVRDARSIRAETEGETVPIIVPKSQAALNTLPRDLVAGYPIGSSDIQASDFSIPSDWAGRRVHLLGGSPPKAWTALKQLTGIGEQTQLSAFGSDSVSDSDGNSASQAAADGGGERATVIGHDWNGLSKVAFKGEYWHRETPHWRNADRLSIRETVKRGLVQVRRYWKERGVWPATMPKTVYGPAEPTTAPEAVKDLVCACCGTACPESEMEATVEVDSGWVLALCSRSCVNWAPARIDETPVTGWP